MDGDTNQEKGDTTALDVSSDQDPQTLDALEEPMTASGSEKMFITDADENGITVDGNSNGTIQKTEDDNETDIASLTTALDGLSTNTSGSDDFNDAVDNGVSSTTPSLNGHERAMTKEDVEDGLHSLQWKLQKRHIFILSESGKPIYTRHGNEEKLVTLFGLLQALVSVIQDGDDTIRSIKVGETNFVFLLKSPLIFVCVSRLDECAAQIQIQLMYFYNQIISILTFKQLNHIYEKRKNYDLRRLLSGSERLLNNLANLVENDPSFTLGAVKCLPLASSVRETISQTITQTLNKLKQNVVFAILIANNQLVSLVRMKKCFMHPMDLHIILNLIDSSESFKSAESWTPLCLPRFDSSGFVHGHVSYLSEDCQACLVLLTVDRESFFILSDAKQKIVDRLRRHNCLEALNASMNNPWPTMSYVNIPEMRHFLYKSRLIAQFSSPVLDIPYTEPGTESASNIQGRFCPPELSRLYSTYFKMHSKLHGQSRPIKLIYMTSNTENWLGWLTAAFELYVVFEPLVTKKAAITSVNKLLKWVKKDEDRIFIINSPTF